MDGDNEVNEVEDLDEDSFARLVAEAIGDDLDQSMIDEFRNSEYFEEFLRSLEFDPNAPNSSTGRPILNDSQHLAIVGNHGESTASASSRKEESDAVASSKQVRSRSKKKTIGKEGAFRNGKFCQSPSKSSIPPSNAAEKNITAPPKRERSKFKPPNTSTPASLGSGRDETKKCSVPLCDLKNIASAFPVGIQSPVIITAKMLDLIQSIELEVRSSKKFSQSYVSKTKKHSTQEEIGVQKLGNTTINQSPLLSAEQSLERNTVAAKNKQKEQTPACKITESKQEKYFKDGTSKESSLNDKRKSGAKSKEAFAIEVKNKVTAEAMQQSGVKGRPHLDKDVKTNQVNHMPKSKDSKEEKNKEMKRNPKQKSENETETSLQLLKGTQRPNEETGFENKEPSSSKSASAKVETKQTPSQPQSKSAKCKHAPLKERSREPKPAALKESSHESKQVPLKESSHEAKHAPFKESSHKSKQAPLKESSHKPKHAPLKESSLDSTQAPLKESSLDSTQAPLKESSLNSKQAPLKEISHEPEHAPLKESSLDSKQASLKESSYEPEHAPLKESSHEPEHAPLKESSLDSKQASLKESSYEPEQAPLKESSHEPEHAPLKESSLDSKQAPLKESSHEPKQAPLKERHHEPLTSKPSKSESLKENALEQTSKSAKSELLKESLQQVEVSNSITSEVPKDSPKAEGKNQENNSMTKARSSRTEGTAIVSIFPAILKNTNSSLPPETTTLSSPSKNAEVKSGNEVNSSVNQIAEETAKHDDANVISKSPSTNENPKAKIASLDSLKTSDFQLLPDTVENVEETPSNALEVHVHETTPDVSSQKNDDNIATNIKTPVKQNKEVQPATPPVPLIEERPLDNAIVSSEGLTKIAPSSECVDQTATPESSVPSPGDADDDLVHDDSSPSPAEVAEVTKSPSADRVVSKKKKIIESSSDDGDLRKDTCDDTDTTDQMKSSDEEQIRKALAFERKKEESDSRYRKFDRFEHERQRKLSDKKKEKEKSKEYDPLEEVLKEKPLTGSFRIPKKTNHKARYGTPVVATPLATANVPKENLQFERCRKGSDKRDREDWNFRGQRYDKTKKDPGAQSYFNYRNRLTDDNRKVVLRPTESEDKVPEPDTAVDTAQPAEQEPMWDDDRSGGGSGIDNDTVDFKFNKSEKLDLNLNETETNKKPEISNNEPSKPETIGTLEKAKITKTLDGVELSKKTERIDQNRQSEGIDPSRQPELFAENRKTERNDQVRKLARTDRSSKPLPDQIRKSERIDITRKPERVDLHGKSERTDKTRRPERVDLNRKSERTDKTRKPEDPGTIKKNKEIEDEAGDTQIEKSSTGDAYDPEVPYEKVEVTQLTAAVETLIDGGIEVIQLPDVDSSINLFESTVMRLAWWFVRADFEDFKTASECDTDDGGSSECSFLDQLELSDDDSDASVTHEGDWSPCNEFCGRSLLTAKYRSGPGDTFANIFQVRSGGSYDKENFQARCNLCNALVVGRSELASHILSDQHKEKMASTGTDSTNSKSETKKNKDATKGNEPAKLEEGKGKDDKEKFKKNESGNKDNKNDGVGKVFIKQEEGKVERRRRSKERTEENHRKSADDEIFTTSTGLPIKIPAGAIPDRNLSNTRNRSKSRSRSPRHKRHRSRSPRRRRSRSHSRSPRGRRRRSRSRTPIQRIPRSPTKVRELRRRSTSAERVEKFLAKTNLRNRSRSPGSGHNRKRRRRSRSKSPQSILPKRNNKEFCEKLALIGAGKWTDEMEQTWKLMEADEAIFMEQYGEKRKLLNDTPEKHPNYADEWSLFWDRRFREVEQQGLDPEEYDYVPEWKEYWGKRLRELLDLEFENGSSEIKKKYGMDFESLQKLREVNVDPSPISNPVVMPNAGPALNPVLAPNMIPGVNPVLAGNNFSEFNPVVVPSPVPPPLPVPNPMLANFSTTPTPVLTPSPCPAPQSTASASVKSFCEGEDLVARSMSISDGGSLDGVRNASNSSAQVAKSQPITTDDIISQWKKLKSGGLPQPSLTPTPTPQPKPTRSVDLASNNDSASIDSLEFNGIYLVHILRIMSADLEDQLSFFAPKVKDYFKTAEELDLKKPNKSNELLHDEDFVVMLFHIRDRFMAMIRANILSNEVLQKLNITVYSLNELLDHPLCQKFRSKLASAAASLDIDKQDALSSKHSNASKDSEKTSPANPNHSSASTSHGLPDEKKESIAKLIAEFLMSQGRNDISDSELRVFVRAVVPEVASSFKTKNNDKQHTTAGKSAQQGGRDEVGPTDVQRVPERTKMYSIASSKGVGSAVPQLPDHTLPLFHRNMNERFPSPRCDLVDGFEMNHSSSESASGRRSPFSRRDYTGNPASNRPRDKGRGRIETQHDGVSIRNQRLHMLSPADDVRENTLSENLETLKTNTGSKSNLGLHPPTTDYEEITINSLLTGRSSEGKDSVVDDRRHEDADQLKRRSADTSVHVEGKPALPPGIMQFIMKERNSRAKPMTPTIESDVEYERRKRRRRKRKGKKKYYDYDDNSSDVESESHYQKERRKDRSRRRKKKGRKRKRGKHESSNSSEESDDSSCGFKNHRTRLAPPLYDRRTRVLARRNDNDNAREVFRISRCHIPSPTLSSVSSKKSVKIIFPSCRNKLSERDNLSDVSSVVEINAHKQGAKSVEELKVTSVSETFWKENNEEKSVCSISSCDLLNHETRDSSKSKPEKMKRQLRGSHDVDEKEPGEVSSSD